MWSPVRFSWDPYSLTAVKVEEEVPGCSEDACKTSAAQPAATEVKKRKPGRQPNASVHCQVPGCTAELHGGKQYYKRYRICQHHCNLPSIVIEGQKQRFCQQCGRYHQLEEFEDSKKSCRRKLRRHNERRRSTQAKPRHHKQWDGSDEGDDELWREEEASPAAKARPVRKGARLASRKASPPQHSPVTSDRSQATASLSPASSEPPAQAVSPPAAAAAECANRSASLTQSLLQQLGIRSPAARQPGAAANGSGSSGTRDLRTRQAEAPLLDGMESMLKDVVAEGGQAGAPVPPGITPLVSGAEEDLLLMLGASVGSAGRAPGALSQGLLPQCPAGLPLFEDDFPLMPLPCEDAEMLAGAAAAAAPLPSLWLAPPQAVPSLLLARVPAGAVLAEDPSLVCYTSSHRLIRVSMKVFNCTPEMLMPTVRQELETLLQVSPLLLEGYIRPGCTHLTLDVWAKAGEGGLSPEDFRAAVETMLGGDGLGSASTSSMLIQLGDRIAVVENRKVMAVVECTASSGLLPHIETLRPLCALAAVAGGPAEVKLEGQNIATERDLVLARQHGLNLTLELTQLAEGSGPSLDLVEARVLGAFPGIIELEVQRGTLVGQAKPLLVLSTAAAVAEVRQLEISSAGIDCVDDFLRDVGLVVRYLGRAEAAEAGRPAPEWSERVVSLVGQCARRIVPTAVSRGWAELTRTVLPAVTAGGYTAEEATAAIDGFCPRGMGLLHIAASSGTPRVVSAVAEWCAAVGTAGRWQVDAKGQRGLTPLHCAAMLPNSSDIRKALAEMPGSVDKLWDLARADDGSTPGALADALRDGAAASAAKAAAHASPSAGPAAKRANTGAKAAGEGRAASHGWKASASGGDALCTERAQSQRARKNAKLRARERHVAEMIKEVAGIAGATAEGGAEGKEAGGVAAGTNGVGGGGKVRGAGAPDLALRLRLGNVSA